MAELDDLRRQIDEVDEEIVRAFEKRIKIAEEVARCKIEKGLPVLDRIREAALLKSREQMLSDRQLKRDIDRVYELLMSISRAHQQKLMKAEKKPAGAAQAVKVAYAGVQGAYADMARYEYFGESSKGALSFDTFEGVFDAVQTGDAQYGIVPIENSYAGSVEEVYDLLNQYDVYIVGEQLIHIEHELLGIPGADIGQIEEVYSHDQGLLQCAGFLDGYPQWKQIPYYNTAISAKFVAESGDVRKAAIASEYAAEVYGLEILRRAINSSGENTTRFIVISDEYAKNNKANKASLSFVLEHKPGALAHVLDVFAKQSLNMVKIESRPLRHRNFEYRFYVDFAGEGLADLIEPAVQEIKAYCSQMKLLGIYENGY